MRCSSCKQKSIYYRANEGRYYCKRHFTEAIEKKVKKTIAQNKLIGRNDRVAVALSGGKDSSNLLYILNKFFGKEIKLFAVSVDEGIKGYRNQAIKSASKLCKQLKVKHSVVSFKKEFGITIDRLVKEKGLPCTHCGVLRRYLLNKSARKLGTTKLATGHNLDDEAQSILMNVIKGDFLRFSRLGPMPKLMEHKKFVVRIKPLIWIPENESVLYNETNKIPSFPKKCPYAKSDRLRGYSRKFLNELGEKSPGIKYSLVTSGYRISNLIGKSIKQEKIGTCIKCKEPSSQKICKVCELLG